MIFNCLEILKEEGLFRISGNKLQIEDFKVMIDKGWSSFSQQFDLNI